MRVRDFRAAGIELFMLQSQPFEAEMRRFVEDAELRPLSFEHILEYLAKRGVEEAHRMPMAMTLAGNPNVLAIATGVDSYFNFKKKQQG